MKYSKTRFEVSILIASILVQFVLFEFWLNGNSANPIVSNTYGWNNVIEVTPNKTTVDELRSLVKLNSVGFTSAVIILAVLDELYPNRASSTILPAVLPDRPILSNTDAILRLEAQVATLI